jgi:hypothetical protein
VFFRIIAGGRSRASTNAAILMPFVLFLPLISLAIYLIPIYLLRRRTYARAQDYFLSSGYTPPGVIRNSSVAYALNMATFGPFFAWGASGDFWPAIINSACFGLGVCLIYILRRPMLAFMESALAGGRSVTVHEFIARQHGNDARVRLLASGLTIFAMLALTIGEALVLAAFLKPVLFGNAVSTYAFVCGLVALMAVYAIVSGNSGVMRSAQSQLGMCYLGLFGAAALLLYLMISALRPMTPHSTFAVIVVAACCAIVPLYRRSRYMDTGPIRAVSSESTNESGRDPFAARLFRRFEKILNACISVFAAWVIVVAGMQLYSDGFAAAATGSIAALATATRVSGVGLAALVLLPLFHPLVDMANWQRIAVFAKDAGAIEPGRRPAAFRAIVRIYAVETPLMSLFMCMFGVIGVVTMATPDRVDAIAGFLRELTAEQNELAAAALSLLLLSVFAIALSTMSSLFSASLCTVRYDVLPAIWPNLASAKGDDGGEATRWTVIAGGGLYVLTTVAGLFIADAYLKVSYASSAFLALLFAFSCAQLAFVPLLLGPLIGRTRDGFATVSSAWALVILVCGAAAGLMAVAIYLATGSEPWLWAAVPACLASGLLLFTVARLWPARTAAAA